MSDRQYRSQHESCKQTANEVRPYFSQVSTPCRYTILTANDKIVSKLKRFVTSRNQVTEPSPLPYFSWAAIDELEALLLVSVVSTSTRLHTICATCSTYPPELQHALQHCRERYKAIMAPAAHVCKALNVLRGGNFQGDIASLELVLTCLRYVKEKYNPIIPEFRGSEEQRRVWTLRCNAYVEAVIAKIEFAAGFLTDEGTTRQPFELPIHPPRVKHGTNTRIL